MATCKDCLHVEVCNDYAINYFKPNSGTPIEALEKEVGDYPCCRFQDHSLFVKLPCKVRDIVYCLTFPEKRRVTRITVTQYGLRITVNDMFSFDMSQIGKTVFLTKEEAEQALKERETDE